jgi:hypothetical protein
LPAAPYVPSNNQEHEQGSGEDYPIVEMHEQTLSQLAQLAVKHQRQLDVPAEFAHVGRCA